MKSLEHPVIKSQRIVKGSVLFMWYILLPTPEVYVKVATWELITKDLIVRIDYEGWSRVSNESEVSRQLSGSILLLSLRACGKILGASYDSLTRGWSF